MIRSIEKILKDKIVRKTKLWKVNDLEEEDDEQLEEMMDERGEMRKWGEMNGDEWG